MRFDVAHFLTLLRSSGAGLGEPVVFEAETPSTNDLAKQAAARGAPSGALFLADAQTAGRGRSGKKWLAPAGTNLLLSLILRPKLPLEQMSLVTLAAGLGTAEGLQPYSCQPLSVKWPNDVLAGDKKVSGILTEANLDTQPALILGIGINVLTQQFDERLQGLATCLADLDPSSPLTREAVLVSVLEQLGRRLRQLQREGSRALLRALRERDALRGQAVRVGDVDGKAAGISAKGSLLIETPERGLVEVNSGTVDWERWR